MSRAWVAPPGTAELVRALVTDTFGRPVSQIERMTFGHGSVTYRVSTSDATVIVRTNVDASVFRGTAANIDTLRGLGLPVPTVLASDLTGARVPFAYVITDAFRGRDLRYEIGAMTAPQLTRLAEQIVGFERYAMTLPRGRSYGFLPIGAVGGHTRWIDAVRADRTHLDVRDDAELEQLAVDVNALLDRLEPRLAAVEPVCFLDDLTTKNVIVHDGALQGVVDFDVVCHGDPMYWLALTQVAVLSDIGTAGQFYVDALTRLWQPTDVDRANFALYCALHAVAFLAASLGASPVDVADPDAVPSDAVQPVAVQPDPVRLGSALPAATLPASTMPASAQPDAARPGAASVAGAQPPAGQPGAVQPGAAQPGAASAVQPGAVRPGAVQPAGARPPAGSPGAAQPGAASAVQPGAVRPGAVQPGAARPGVASVAGADDASEWRARMTDAVRSWLVAAV